MKQFPILILHGWNLSAKKFNPLIKEFTERNYQVIIFDLPGFGKERIPNRPYYLSDYVNFVEKNCIVKK